MKVGRLNRKEFEEVFKTGARTRGACVSLVFRVSDTPKLSVVVGKKHAKKATTRNKLKRQLRAVASEYMKDHKLSLICMYTPKKGGHCKTFKDLAQDIETALNKL